MSKSTPYEMRQGLLSQAQHILSEKYRSAVEAVRIKQDHLIRTGSDPSSVQFPLPPTSEEIIAEAEKLYKFVCKK